MNHKCLDQLNDDMDCFLLVIFVHTCAPDLPLDKHYLAFCVSRYNRQLDKQTSNKVLITMDGVIPSNNDYLSTSF